MPALIIGSLLLMLATMVGCETFTRPTQVISVERDQAKVVDTVATRRGTYLIKKAAVGTDEAERWVLVAEPPPDAALASVVKAAMEIAAKTPSGVDATGKGNVAVTQEITKLVERTQAITILRDGLFRLSEAYANGAITRTEYVTKYDKALAAATDIATAELRLAEARKKEAETENLRTQLHALEAVRSLQLNNLSPMEQELIRPMIETLQQNVEPRNGR